MTCAAWFWQCWAACVADSACEMWIWCAGKAGCDANGNFSGRFPYRCLPLGPVTADASLRAVHPDDLPEPAICKSSTRFCEGNATVSSPQPCVDRGCELAALRRGVPVQQWDRGPQFSSVATGFITGTASAPPALPFCAVLLRMTPKLHI